MAQVVWANAVIDDLQRLREYFEPASPKFAEKLMDQLISRNRMLADFQQSGRKLPEAPNVESLRKLLEGNCRIIYELLLNEQILILKIHHISRLLDCLVDR